MMMEVRGVTAGYGAKVVLRDINLMFRSGVNIVLGPNGAGKTTLFRVCSGALRPYKGDVLIDGRNVHSDVELKRLIGYLPHRDGLISELTVRDNLIFYANIYNIGERLDARILELARIFDVENLLDTRVAQLSHGQRRRVALVRTLLHDPKVLLLDEPSNGLDPLAAKNLRKFVKKLVRARDVVVVYSTHNLYEALELADRVAIISYGRIVFQGSLEELKRFLGGIKVGLRVRGNPLPVLSSLGYQAARDGNMWVVEVKSEDEIGRIVEELTRNNIVVLEVKEIGNPLEEILERVR